MERTELKKILIDLRKEKKLTQIELAKKAGLAPSCISMIERGNREANANTIYSLALALEVSADYLLGLEDELGLKLDSSSNAIKLLTCSEEEKELIRAYRSLDFDQRNVILIQLKALVEHKA